MAILNHGSTIRTADGGQSTTTIVTASNIGSYAVASSATYYIGTTQNVFNRASGAQTLTGVSIDGNAANITAYTINQNVGTSNTPSFAGIVSSAITNYAFLQVTDTNNFWITPGNNNWGLYFETSAGGLLGGSGDSNRLGFVGAGAARFYVDLNNGNGWFGASLTANTDSRAPIFYDTNNTAYYIDAASTSVINALSVSTLNNINAANGTWHTSSEGKARFYFASNGTTYFRTGNDYVFRNNSDIGVVVIDSVGNLRTSTSGDNSPSYSLHVGGTGFASADFRAPIFYDSNDTTYYIDPASTSTSANFAGQIRQNAGKYVRDFKDFQWVSGSGNYYSNGAEGWYKVAQITITSNCSGAVLYGRLYDRAYHDCEIYDISVVIRAECDFTTNNESHFVEIGCTVTASSEETNYRDKIRAILTASSTNSRTYELQFYETAWNSDSWELFTTGWTVWDSAQAPGTATGTARVNYQSKMNADTMYANESHRAPVFYDSDNTSYYINAAGASSLNTLTMAGIITTVSSGTAINFSGQSDSFGYNATAGQGTYIKGTGGTYIYGGGVFYDGSAIRTLLHSNNYSGYSTFSGSVTAQYGSFATPSLIMGDAQYGFYVASGNVYYKSASGGVHYWRNIANSANTMSLDNSGILTVAGNLSAPIFYDSNDTAYYVDPNSVSRLASLRVYSAFDTASSDVYANMRVMRNNATTDGMYIGYGNSGSTSALTRIFGGGATTGELSKYSTYTLEPGSFRSPIFYDSDNTGYYLDAASTSNLNILGVAGRAGIGGAGSRSTNGLTVGFTDNSTFAANTDVGDTDRMLSIVNESSTTNAMAVLGFRVNPNGATANAMLDIKFVQTGATNTSALHYTFNHGGSFLDRFTILSSGNVGIGIISPSGKLHVYNSTSVDTILESGTSGTTGKLIFKTSDNVDLNKYIMQENYYMILNGHANEGFKFRDSASNVLLSIFGSNNAYASRVGIGTQTPGYKLDVNGAINSSTYVYAGVFYDNDNTAYYANPSGASIFNGLKLVSSGNEASGSDYSLWIQGGNEDWGIGIDKSAANYGITYNLAASHTYAIQGRKNGAEYFRLGTDMLSHDTRLQAPIFYDNNNTAYYIDPASTSVLNRLTIDGGNYAFDYFQSLSDFTSGTLVTTDIPATAAEGESFVMNVVGKSYSASTSPFNFSVQGYLYNSTIINFSGLSLDSTALSTVKIFENGGVLCFWWPTISYWNAFEVSVRAYNSAKNNYNRVTNITNSTEPTGTKKVTVTLQRFLRADVSATNSVDLRAPIFYDSNDTTYYTDPSSLSNILELKTNKNWYDSSASAWGGGINMGGNNPSIGFQSTASTWWYMLHHSSSNINFYRRSTSGSWNHDGIWDSSGNLIWQGSSVRAPIFYDQNNTAYYLDPNSGSNLYDLTLSGAHNVYLTINPGNGYEAMVRYIGGTGSSWYVGKRTSAQLVGTANFHFYSEAAGATVGGIDTSGNIYSIGSVRSPIFYDSDNTAYYINAASVSNLNAVTLADNIDVGTYIYLRNNFRMLNSASNGWIETIVRNSGSPYFTNPIDGGTFLASDTSENNNWLFQEAARGWGLFYFNRGTQSGQTFGSYTTIGAETFIIGQGSGTTMTSTWTGYNASSKVAIMLSNYTGYIWANDTIFSATGLRAPIFYDSDDTNFYANPAGESKFNYLRLTNNNALYFTTTGVAELNNEGNSTNVAFRMIKSGSSNADGNNYGVLNLQRTNHTNAATNAGASIFFELKDSGGTIREYAGLSGCKTEAGAAGGRLIFHRYARTEIGYWDVDQLFANASMRSPIFYDSDNTGYYLNPAGLSQLSAVYANDWFRAQGNTGLYFQDKGYGITSAGAAGNSYGNASTYGTGVNGWQGWGIGSRHCLMSNGGDNVGIHDNSRSWLYYWDGTYHRFQYGYFEAAGSVRGPIFYDSNDTGYYVDPNSASNLVSVTNRENLPGGSGNTYYWSGSAMSFYWTKIANVGGGNTHAAILITYKTDVNYNPFGLALLSISAFNSQTFSVKLEKLNGDSMQILVRVDNNNDVWLLTAAEWSSYKTWKVISKLGSPTVYYSSLTEQLTTPANSIEIASGQEVRGNQGAATSATVSTVANHLIGGLTVRSDVRAPIFYDSNDTAFYLDPAGTSNLNKFSTLTMSYNDMNPMHVNSPYVNRYNGSSLYRNGTMGYGTTDCNVMFSNWGSGFIDSWSSPANAPGGSTHYVGFQGFHYNHQNNSQAYGFQMLYAGGTNNRFFWRSAWPDLYSWVEMIHSGNIGSQTVATAGSCTGNSATVTNGVYTNTGNTYTGANYFQSNLGTTSGSLSGPPLQAYATGTNAAFMSFHRSGSYAVNMGLDSDNVLRIGGWSASANRLQLDMSGNLTVAGAMYGTNFIDSDNTAYFCNPASTSNLVGLTVANTITGAVSGNAGSVTINYNNDSNSTYQMLWGSGNNVYGTAGVYLNPSTDVLYANAFYDAGNTAYYLDPNSTSNLLLVKTRNTFGERVAVTAASSTTIDTQYNVTELTMSTNVSLALSNIQSSGTVHMWTIVTVGNGTAYSIGWPAAIKWPGGTAPTITSTNTKRDIYQFVTYDGGTNIYAIIVGQNL